MHWSRRTVSIPFASKEGIFWYGAYILFALALVRKVHAYQAVTLPDLVARMFGPRSSKVAAVFTFFNVLPIVYVISLGALLEAVFDIPRFPATQTVELAAGPVRAARST